MRIYARAWAFAASLVTLMSCASAASATGMTGDPAATCSGLAGSADGAVRIDTATLQTPTPLSVADKAPTPAARIIPANPAFCKVLAHIDPADPTAPPIKG